MFQNKSIGNAQLSILQMLLSVDRNMENIIPDQFWDELLRSPFKVKLSLAQSTWLPKILYERLADDPMLEVRLALSNNPAISPEILAQLLTPKNASLIQEIKSGNWVLENFWEEALLTNQELFLFARFTSDFQLQKAFVGCPDTRITRALVKNLLASSDILREVYERGSPAVKTMVLLNRNCPKDLVREINNKSEWGEQFAVASNPGLVAEVAERLVKSERENVLIALARNGSTPRAILERLMRHPNEEVRSGVALNESLDIADFLFLSKDACYRVRENLAKNTKTPECVLRQLITEENETIIYFYLVTHPKLPEDMAIDLLRNQNFLIFCQTAGAMTFSDAFFVDRNFSSRYDDALQEAIRQLPETLKINLRWTERLVFIKNNYLAILNLSLSSFLLFLYMLFDFEVPLDFISFLIKEEA
jgi:hypothetical protein